MLTDCLRSISSDNHQYPISQLSQLIVLTRRTLLCTYRDIHLFYFRFFTQIAIGFLLGLVFYDMGNDGEKVISNASCIFFFLMVIYFCNTFPVIVTCKDESNYGLLGSRF
jgi:ABC-2 type transporter